MKKTAGDAIMATMLLSTLFGCSASDLDGGTADDNEPIRFLVADDDGPSTRGAYETAKEFKSYSIYSFLGIARRLYVGNIVMNKDDGGSWLSSRTISFPGKNAVDFYAMKPGFVRDDVRDLVMTYPEKSFVHTLPNVNTKQTDFMISSLLEKTKEETGGTLLFKFKHLFAYLRFVGKVAKEGLNVKVHSITIHNIKSTGKFTFSNGVEKDGSWELSDEKDNYTYILPEDKDLTSKNAILHTTDSMLFVMAQTPEVFAIAENTSFADADEEGVKKTYLEIECRLWTMKDDGAGGQTPEYIGCTETTWAKVYYPMAVTTKWQTPSSPYSGTYNVMFDFTGGYTYEGEDFLKKHTSGAMKMVSVEPVQSFLVVDPWTDDDTNSVTIEMK